jgi:hypothetical protein
VLEQFIGKAELLRQQVGDLVVTLGFEDRVDDLIVKLVRLRNDVAR